MNSIEQILRDVAERIVRSRVQTLVNLDALIPLMLHEAFNGRAQVA